jgi:hypothetical protein
MSWTWETLRDDLGKKLDGPMKALEGYLKLAEKTAPILARVMTSNATVTTLHTFPIPVNTVVHVEANVVARRTGGLAGAANDGAAYTLFFAATNTAGTAALIGSVTVTAKESQAGWDCTADCSSGDARIRVTGAVDNDVQWRLSYRTQSVKE